MSEIYWDWGINYDCHVFSVDIPESLTEVPFNEEWSEEYENLMGEVSYTRALKLLADKAMEKYQDRVAYLTTQGVDIESV